MASLRNHKVIEVWRMPDSDVRYYVTASDRVLRSTGPRGGGPKILFSSMAGDQFFKSPLSGHQVRRATATEWKANSTVFPKCVREEK